MRAILRRYWLYSGIGALVVSAFSFGADRATSSNKPFGIDQRVAWTTSRVLGSPDPPPLYRARRAFAKLTFDRPRFIVCEPGGARFMIVQRGGKILSFRNDPDTATTEVFCDVGDLGVYSLAFHPHYQENGYVYVFTNDGYNKVEKKKNRIFRFQTAKTAAGKCDPNSRLLLLEWYSQGHDGGDLAFGPDGCLYISSGDGSADSDANNAGQNLRGLASGILRIDVDHAAAGHPYAVPKDNPFLGIAGARPEKWAYGLRNPWRMSFDSLTGDLWVGDVGQDLWEMIYLVRAGGNYGWSVFEGTHPFQPERKAGPTPISRPIVEHPHSEMRCIIGGYFYHGARLKELQGVYLYGDWVTGRIWGLRYEGGKVVWHKELATTPCRVLGFGLDPEGEIYFVDNRDDAGIYRLEPAPPEQAGPVFPRKLSDTGLFASAREHQVQAGLIPYSVNSALWSDGAAKERFLALPGTAQIEFSEKDPWKFPEGTVLVKTFFLQREVNNDSSRRRVETRLLTLQQSQWHGYSYAWNNEQTDAFLVEAPGLDRQYTMTNAKTDASRAGGGQTQTWHYPSRAECMVCHTEAAGFALGVNTLQMNREHSYGEHSQGGVADNQLRTLEHLGVFRYPQNSAKLPKPPGQLPRLVSPQDPAAGLAARARSYLHANCAHCHTLNGGGNALMDLGFTKDDEAARIIGAKPQHDAFDIKDALLIAPGDPERSLIYHRMMVLGRGRMPPLSSSVRDIQATQLIAEWIKQMKPGADEEN
jgi:uncharacterized repeat protein (TIGR03806 family)